MSVFKISKAAIKEHRWRYVLYCVLSTLAAGGSMGIAYLISAVITDYFSPSHSSSNKYAYLFLLSLTVFFVSRWFVSSGIIRLTQDILRRTKLDILRMVIRSPYTPLMATKERIYTAMTRDAANIAQASISVVDIITNSIIAIICFVYMGMLSWQLLLSLLVLLIFTVNLYLYSAKRQRTLFFKAMSHEDQFIRYLNEILNGFKEIVIDRRKGMDIERQKLVSTVNTAVDFNRRAYVMNLNNRIIGQMAFYLFIGLVLIFLSKAFNVPNTVTVNFIFLVLYVFGPLETVIVLLPGLAQANASYNKLSTLQENLRNMELEKDETAPDCIFNGLEARSICYDYKDEKTGDVLFSVGPVDFQIAVGEVVFIFGGNGSGKTTFINLLTGLFTGGTGEIFVNGVNKENMGAAAYRLLFAPLFSDYHLFDECYGIENIDAGKAQFYLEMFELDKKISFDGNKFTSIDLSAGQKKRLALIYAMLENKPILVLDEFAADQDPYFRKKFYHEILDFIRKEGFTVIAVTHDDNYYRYCDKLYKMESGRLDLVKIRDLDALTVKAHPVIEI